MSVTVSMDHCGSYYASILMEQDICPKPKTGKTVGIDVGLKSLITTSDGLQVSMPRENQAGIKHMQRIMSRKIKGSVRHRKNKLRVAKMHRKIARQREWLAHNITAHLVETYDAIAVEDLNVAGMVKNHRLAGAISNAAWTTLITQIEYKCRLYGKQVNRINRFFPSSKACSKCGNVKAPLKLSDRVYACECGLVMDRDLNAAINIKAVGVDAALQTARGCQPYIKGVPLKQAIPVELLNVL